MTLQTSHPNGTIKSRKQQSTQVTAEGRKTYRKSQFSRTFQTKKRRQNYSKAVTLRYTN